ncbi:hypothetical protein J4433_03340 [Candidatus Pacearchaeota archaeon]|nr:hypothetical protein [Candidatus Pacearchaeota archaeon]
MKNTAYKIREFFKELINPYYSVRKEQQELSHRCSILEKLASERGSISVVPLDEIEKQLGITETRNDMGNYIPCCS